MFELEPGSGDQHEAIAFPGLAKLLVLPLWPVSFLHNELTWFLLGGRKIFFFSVLLKPVCIVHITAIPQKTACDVMVKGSVKGQGKRYFFLVTFQLLIKNHTEEIFSITGAGFFKKGAEAQ